MIYKHHVIDDYYEQRAQPVREAIGFYWALRSRDHIQDIAESFIQSLEVLQEVDPLTGDFLNFEKDSVKVCLQDFMDYMDIAMFNAINYCDAKEKERYNKEDFSIRELQKLSWTLLDDDYKKYEELDIEEKKNYIRQCLWNYEDFKESFQFSLKKFTNELIQKFVIPEPLDDEQQYFEDSVDLQEEGFICSVKDIYSVIKLFTEKNKGLPAKRDDAEEHTEKSLELIGEAMWAKDFVDFTVNYLVDEVK